MATYDLGKVVGDTGEKGDSGSSVWNTSTAPTYSNSKYTFNISNLSGKAGLEIAVNDIIFYSTYYYIVSAVNTSTVDCSTRVSIKGSDASVTIVDNLTSTSSTSALSAKQGKVLNDNKIETSAIATSFGSTPSDSKVASEKLVKNSLDGKQATLVSGTNIKTINNESLLGSGNIDIQGSSVDIVTSWEQTPSDEKVPSEKLTKDTLDTKANASSLSAVATSGSYADLSNKPTIPSKISDLQNDSDFIETSSTSGLIKNDGSIDTNSYLTSSALGNYVQKSSTSGLIKNDGSIDTTNYSTFDGDYDSLSNKPTIPSKISDLTNDSDFIEKSSTSGLVKNDGSIMTSGTGSSNWAVGNHTHSDYVSATKVTSWSSTVSNDNVPSEKLVKDSLDDKLDNALSSSSSVVSIENNDIPIISDFSDGYKLKGVPKLNGWHIKDNTAHSNIGSIIGANQETINGLIDTALGNKISKSSTTGLVKNDGTIDTTSYSTFSGSYNDLSNKPTIPSKISDLTNDSDFIETSSTTGLVKNDGTIDTNAYITNSALTNYVQKSNTSGLIKNDGSIDTNTYLTELKVGSNANYIVCTTTNGVLVAKQKLGNITYDGKIGSSANYFVYTTTDGKVNSKEKIGNITTSGAIGSTSGLPIITTTSGVLTTGSFGTSSGTFAEGNHTHSGYVSATKVTSWQSTPSDNNVPSEKLVSDTFDAIEDLIGDAITYINQ